MKLETKQVHISWKGQGPKKSKQKNRKTIHFVQKTSEPSKTISILYFQKQLIIVLFSKRVQILLFSFSTLSSPDTYSLSKIKPPLSLASRSFSVFSSAVRHIVSNLERFTTAKLLSGAKRATPLSKKWEIPFLEFYHLILLSSLLGKTMV